MIKPHKHLELNSCVLNVCKTILRELLESKMLKYEELYNMVIQKNGSNAKYNFVFALDFLFLVGKIKYYQNSDSVELIL